jgi:hypothetical protein
LRLPFCLDHLNLFRISDFDIRNFFSLSLTLALWERERVRAHRQRERELAPLPQFALHPNPPALQLDKLSRQRQPETRALALLCVVAARLSKRSPEATGPRAWFDAR